MPTEQHKKGPLAASGCGHPTRQAVLIDHLKQWMHQRGGDLATFAEALASCYSFLVPTDHRSLTLPIAPAADTCQEYMRWIDKLRKQVERFIDGSVRLPAEIEEAWVAALPQPYRTRCIQELAARYHLLPVEIPEDEPSAEDLGALLEAAGRETSAAAPIFADGRVTKADVEYLPAAIRAHEQSGAASLSMAASLRRALEEYRQRPGAVTVLKR